MKSVGNLMALLERLFKKMSELEYVGLMRENIVLSEDSAGHSPEEEKKGMACVGVKLTFDHGSKKQKRT